MAEKHEVQKLIEQIYDSYLTQDDGPLDDDFSIVELIINP